MPQERGRLFNSGEQILKIANTSGQDVVLKPRSRRSRNVIASSTFLTMTETRQRSHLQD